MVDIINVTKQGCVLVSLLFSIFFFATMVLVASKDCNLGVNIQFQTDSNVCDIRRLQAKTKLLTAVIRDLLLADDCALVAHAQQAVQQLFDCFADTAKHFGLNVTLKKTEVLHQSHPATKSATATLHSNGWQHAPCIS